MQLWTPQAGKFGLSLTQQVLSPVLRPDLEIPLGEDLAPAGPAMSPTLPEEPLEKDVKHFKHILFLYHYCVIMQMPYLKAEINGAK